MVHLNLECLPLLWLLTFALLYLSMRISHFLEARFAINSVNRNSSLLNVYVLITAPESQSSYFFRGLTFQAVTARNTFQVHPCTNPHKMNFKANYTSCSYCFVIQWCITLLVCSTTPCSQIQWQRVRSATWLNALLWVRLNVTHSNESAIDWTTLHVFCFLPTEGGPKGVRANTVE